MSEKAPPLRLAIRVRADVERARRDVRAAALALGFLAVPTEEIVLAASELATNLLLHAHDGTLAVTRAEAMGRVGVRIESRDAGPGIADIPAALRDGASTRRGLGSGLPAVRRLVDEFSLVSAPTGTVIAVCKWRPE